MIHSLLRIAAHLDARGQYDLADRCDSMLRSAARYEWPEQYTLPFDEALSRTDSTSQAEPTPYWQATHVYTLGKDSIYKNLKDHPKKAKGGSVWRTREEAEGHRRSHHLADFSVYEVGADWDDDVTPEDGEEWGSLKRDAPLIISETKCRFIKLAMPYRWEDNEDRARNITREGYDPQDALYTYIDEYADQFEADLSDEARTELEAFKKQIGLDQELQTYGRGGRRWEKYVDRLGELWFDEHPDERLLWLADHPGSAIDFSGGADNEYQNNLLRYSPPAGNEPTDFLNDYSYGYATKVKLPQGAERIPAEWFSVVSPEEWNAHKDDHGHWASRETGFVRLAGYSNEMGNLRYVLREGYSPWDYQHNLQDFMEQQGIEGEVDFEEGDGGDWVNDATPEQLQQFRDYNERYPLSDIDPYMAPPYETLEYEGDSPSMNWQVHFTNEPWDIASQGFRYGHPDMEGVALTTWKSNRTKAPGFNFAFDADRAPNESAYGNDAVIFPSAAVETFHAGDEEHQNIFWGPSVDPRMIFPVTKEEMEVTPQEDQAKGLTKEGWGYTTDMWVVRDWSQRPIFKSESLRDCVGWVDRNWRQLLSTRENIERRGARR